MSWSFALAFILALNFVLISYDLSNFLDYLLEVEMLKWAS